MRVLRTALAITAALIYIVGVTGTKAQATYPAEIRVGNCDADEVAVEITQLALGSGNSVGRPDAPLAANSFSIVPLSLQQLTETEHALVVSQDDGTPIVCGVIGGVPSESGTVVFGLSQLANSGVSGVGVLTPGEDPAQVNLSVFVAPLVELVAGEQAANDESVENPLAVIGEGQPAEVHSEDTAPATTYRSGGLGLTVAAWQKIHGPGKSDPSGLSYNDGEFVADAFGTKKLNYIHQWIPAMTVDDARQISNSLMPADAQFVESYVSPVGLLVDLYYSESLIEQLPDENWTGGEPGYFIVIYGQHGPPVGSGPVTDILLAAGNNM